MVYRIRCGGEMHLARITPRGDVLFEAHPGAFHEISREAALCALGAKPGAAYEGCLRVARAIIAHESMTVPPGDARRLLAAVDGIRHARGVRRAVRRETSRWGGSR